MSALEFSLMTIGAALVCGLWLLHRMLARAIVLRPDPAELHDHPSVSVIRPIKGMDAEVEANVQAALEHGYPGEVETIFVFDDADEPALPVVSAAIEAQRKARGRTDARVLFCGPPPPHRTGKLNAMIVALEQAQGEVIVFADSDIRPPAGSLSTLVSTLRSSPEHGSAFAPVVVQPTPETLGDAGYALLLNGMYGPAAEFAARQNDEHLPFIMGQFMALSREAIEVIGGLEAAEGQFVDDMYLGARIAQVGYANVVAPCRVPIIQRGVSAREFFGIYLRWLTFGRTGLPDWRFKLPPALQGVAFWGGLLLALVGLVVAQWAAVALGALTAFATAHSVAALHHRLGGAPPSWRVHLGAAVVLLLAPAMMIGVHMQHHIDWRGRTYDLDKSSRLAGQH